MGDPPALPGGLREGGGGSFKKSDILTARVSDHVHACATCIVACSICGLSSPNCSDELDA